MAKTSKKRSVENNQGMIVKQVRGFGGLDNIHITLGILIVILIALLVTSAYYKPVSIPTQQNSTATNGTVTNTTNYNESQIGALAKSFLAGYVQTNSSLSLLPFYTNVSAMSVSYMPSVKEWYVQIPTYLPSTGAEYHVYELIRDSNATLASMSIQLASPIGTYDSVAAQGVVAIGGKTSCLVKSPMHIYWFMDPYAPGSVKSLENISSLETKYGNAVNISIESVFGSSYQHIANQVGDLNAQYLGKYMMCAANQKNFSRFADSLNSIYGGDYISQNTLQSISEPAGLNLTELDSCVNRSSGVTGAQALLATYYNITAVPTVVVNCNYLAIPQTASNAICYANSTICKEQQK